GIASKNRAKASVRAKKLAEFRPVSSSFAFMPFDMGFFQRFQKYPVGLYNREIQQSIPGIPVPE
ncbi:MAG: hypothetical protein K2P04_10835, partial [Oscillospiraceae bacterium]|nr:hypothetical protein [Oscillospiraceae bacterium]